MSHAVANVVMGVNLKDIMKKQNFQDYDERYVIKIGKDIIAEHDDYMFYCKLKNMKIGVELFTYSEYGGGDSEHVIGQKVLEFCPDNNEYFSSINPDKINKYKEKVKEILGDEFEPRLFMIGYVH